MTAKVAVIYYSATGTVHALAQAVAEGAASAVAGVRLRRVADLAPGSAIDQNPQWRRHADAATSIAQASVENPAGPRSRRPVTAAGTTHSGGKQCDPNP
jgi:NAD(P)H dehydrogenase (quinone)